MMVFHDSDIKFIDSLITDCITYNLSTAEGLAYVKTRFGKAISESMYKNHKADILSDEGMRVWLNHETRLGYVQTHLTLKKRIEKINEDSFNQLFYETKLTKMKDRDTDKIEKIKAGIIASARLLLEINLDTPIITTIKMQSDTNRKNFEELKKKVKDYNPELIADMK